MADEENKGRMSLRVDTEESIKETMNVVATRVVNGDLSVKQGDVVNTTVKQVIALNNLKLKYMTFLADMAKPRLRDATEKQQQRIMKELLPAFFNGDTDETPQQKPPEKVTKQ